MPDAGRPAPCPCCGERSTTFYGEKNSHQLYGCGACGALAVAPMPSDDELAAFYHDYHKTKQYAAKIDSKLRRAKRRIKMLRSRSRGKGMRLLDAGCNVGFATEAARRLGLDALGVDVDAVAIERARGLFPKARFELADIGTLAEAGERFDLVYCSEVIEHQPRPLAFLRALRECLVHGGRALITTPDMGHRSLPRSPEHMLGTDMIRPPEHLLYFNARAAESALTHSGFTHVRFLTTFKPTLKILAWR